MARPRKTSGPAPRRDAGRPRGAPIQDAVLTSTLEELVAHGIEGASVDRIARVAEVNKTSVYRRWPTREALIAAALERVAVDITSNLGDRGSLRAELLLLAQQVAQLLESPLGRSLARAAMADSLGPELSALARREVSKPREVAVQIVSRARERGEWRAGVSPEILLGALVGALMHRSLLERAPISSAAIEELVDMLVEGVRPRAVSAPCDDSGAVRA